MRDLCRNLAMILGYMVGKTPKRMRPSKRFRRELWIPPLARTQAYSEYSASIPVLYTNDAKAADKWLKEKMPTRPLAVGWDVESSPDLPWRRGSKYHGPATIQISSYNAGGAAALVLQIADEEDGVNRNALPILSGILKDDEILKAGVGLDQDMLELYRLKQDVKSTLFTGVKGRFDMGGIGGSPGNTVSLKQLADSVCGVELQKSRRLATSQWSLSPLTNEQIAYAARDAWASAAVMRELCRRDPSTYSPDVLLGRVLGAEISIVEMDTRASARKQMKLKIKGILGAKEKRRSRKELSGDERAAVKELEQQVKELAPPRPFLFDISSMGF